mmetsp:Transcript_631/g.1850  ORF Transcript_631/g.1850 Transcript_631/m.1850 type:complete len:298 (+) Transcript_631:467-1360(+)
MVPRDYSTKKTYRAARESPHQRPRSCEQIHLLLVDQVSSNGGGKYRVDQSLLVRLLLQQLAFPLPLQSRDDLLVDECLPVRFIDEEVDDDDRREDGSHNHKRENNFRQEEPLAGHGHRRRLKASLKVGVFGYDILHCVGQSAPKWIPIALANWHDDKEHHGSSQGQLQSNVAREVHKIQRKERRKNVKTQHHHPSRELSVRRGPNFPTPREVIAHYDCVQQKSCLAHKLHNLELAPLSLANDGDSERHGHYKREEGEARCDKPPEVRKLRLACERVPELSWNPLKQCCCGDSIQQRS